MDIFHALIFGVVEGVTEFLPVSSTGHLILTAHIMELAQTEFLKSFEIAIQLGAILAVAFIYRKELFKGSRIWKRIAAAFLPSAVIGLALYKLLKKSLMNNEVVLWSLFAGGILLILFELSYKEKPSAGEGLEFISYKQSFLIGLFQSIAIIPGVSRSAATIVGGLFLGLKRRTIVEFSFLLAIPTMLAATALDLAKNGYAFSRQEFSVLAVGFFASFAVAAAAVKLLLYFIKNNNFILFGIYRVCIAILFWFILK